MKHGPKCKQQYCIYNDDFDCILDEIHLNDTGMCEECVIVPLNGIEQEELKRRKQAELEAGKTFAI